MQATPIQAQVRFKEDIGPELDRGEALKAAGLAA